MLLRGGTTSTAAPSPIAVAADGQPWIGNKQGTVFNRTRGGPNVFVKDFNGATLLMGPCGSYVDGQWQVTPGSATDIAAGADGSIWAIGTLQYNVGGNAIHRYNPAVR